MSLDDHRAYNLGTFGICPEALVAPVFSLTFSSQVLLPYLFEGPGPLQWRPFSRHGGESKELDGTALGDVTKMTKKGYRPWYFGQLPVPTALH